MSINLSSVHAFLLITVFSLPIMAGENASFVFVNGKIFTADEQQPWVEALAVKGKTIVAVGNNDLALSFSGEETKVIDLQGRTVVPGFNDSHTHAPILPNHKELELDAFIPAPGPELSTVLTAVEEQVSHLEEGEWLMGEIGMLAWENAECTRTALDTVAPNHPVWLWVWSKQGAVINTKAMEILGVSESEEDPFGGFYERDSNTGILNGRCIGYGAYNVYRKLQATVPIEDAAEQYECYAQDALRVGITSVQDMTLGLDAKRTSKILNQAEIPIRWRHMAMPTSLQEGKKPFKGIKKKGHHDLQKPSFSGVKWFLDGSPIERNAYMTEDYEDAPGQRGYSTMTIEDLNSILENASHGNKVEKQLVFHSVGDAATDLLIETMYNFSNQPHQWANRRVRLEHPDFVTMEDYDMIREMGIVLVQNATHTALKEMFQERYSDHLTEHMQPMRTLIEEGLIFVLAYDGTNFAGNPFTDLFFAAIHPNNPEEAITIEQAVTAYTLWGAYAEFEEHRKGTLTEGKLADLAVLTQDIFTIQFEQLFGVQSALTMVDGEIRYENGDLTIP